MHEMTDEEFEQAIEEALASIPPRFLDALENVGITMADEPSAAQRAALARGEEPSDGTNMAPDMVTIFKRAHERLFSSREEIIEQIRKTVVHEIGHYFGLSDDDLRRMGY